MTLGVGVRVFVTRQFGRFARAERMEDDQLREAVARAERGLVDAELGSGLIKQRVARPGQGRSGGYRTVIAFRRQGRAVFVYGFAKNERDSIGTEDLVRLRKLAVVYLEANMKQLDAWRETKELREIVCDGREIPESHR